MTYMKKICALVFVLLVGVSTRSDACKCSDLAFFPYIIENNDLVVVGKMGKKMQNIPGTQRPLKGEFIVSKVIYGSFSQSKMILVGDSGMDCLSYLEVLLPNEEWVVVLKNNREGVFGLGACGKHYFRFKSNVVYGVTSEGDTDEHRVSDFSLSEFTSKINKIKSSQK